jgi:rhodanese-related sulfurtransferase
MQQLIKTLLFTATLLFSLHSLAETKTMSVQQVHDALSNSEFTGQLIDVRTPEEYAEGHIEGSINVPVGDLDDYLEDLKTLDAKGVVVYCRSGYRASRAIDAMTEAGFKNVTHMEGDMSGWYDAELPVVVSK